MRRSVRTVVAATAVAILLAACAAAWGQATVTIYHTSDIHEQTGNLARIAQFVKGRRQADPNVLLVDSGDRFNKGDLPIMYTRGEAMFALIAACGYDGSVLGNHALSFGTKRLVELADRFPSRLLGANVTWPKDLTPKNAASHKILKLKGVTVALIGTASEHANHASDRLVKFTRVEDAIGKLVPELRKKADIVVLITHVGVERDREIARAVPGIDVICGGHHHRLFRKMVFDRRSRTVIQHSGAYAGLIAEIVLTWDGTKITGRRTRIIKVRPEMPEDAKVKALRAKYVGALAPAKPLMIAPKEMTRAEATKWLADAVRKNTGADAVIMPRELAGPLPAGEITPQVLLKAIPRLEIAAFDVAGHEQLGRVLEAIRQVNKTAVLFADAKKAAKVRVAYPCVGHDRILDPAQAGIDKALVTDLRRIEGRSLWQIAVEAARAQKVVPASKRAAAN